MKLLLAFCFTWSSLSLFSQLEKVDISLDEVIRIAQGEAPRALIAQTRFSNNYWRYQSFLANYKPQLVFVSTIPNLNRSIDNIVLPDGTEKFINRSLMNSSAGIEMRQRIHQTGGFIYGSTNLNRIDLFGTNSGKSYLSAPLRFGFIQPLFQFNSDKWFRQIQGLDYESSKKQYAEEKAQIAYDAVNLFFELYVAQLNLQEARRQKIYVDSLYEVSLGRFDVGRIAETDLLQIELRTKNADTEVATELLNYQTANEQLRTFIGVKDNVEFNLLDPETLPEYAIDAGTALEYAKRYRSQTTEFRIRLLQAQMNMDEARKSGGVNVDLSGSFGLSQTGPTLVDAYRNPIDQEGLTLSLEIPIADWGKNRSEREIAKSNLELTQRTIELENVNFEREVVLRVQQFELKRSQLALARRAADVAEKRVDIAKSRYQIGKIDVTELNIALNEYETARRGYFQSLWALWTAHYEIRNLTLFDFITDKKLADENIDIQSFR
ncbi:MAG: TolC family protein [Saprospiraceae bacterium]|nr:TolC family protein [Saprospiraceae bacterium]